MTQTDYFILFGFKRQRGEAFDVRSAASQGSQALNLIDFSEQGRCKGNECPTAQRDSLSEIATMKQQRGQRKEKRRAKRQRLQFCSCCYLHASYHHLCDTEKQLYLEEECPGEAGFGWDALEMQL